MLTKPQTQIEISTIYNSGERLQARDSLISHESEMSRCNILITNERTNK